MKLFKFQSDHQFIRLGQAVESLLNGQEVNLDELVQDMPEMVRPMLAKIQDRLRAEEAAAQTEQQRFKTLIEQLGKDDAQWRTDCPEALLAPVESLAERIKVLRTRDAALNLVDSKIMIADTDRVLNYCNQSANKLLEDSQSELNKRLGNFRLDEMMGGSIDRYHKNPEQTAEVLRQMKSPKEVTLRFGNKDFRLRVQPLLDKSGEKLGLIAEWVDITEERSATEEITELVRVVWKREPMQVSIRAISVGL